MKYHKPFIRASELKQWDYCPRQWYLVRTTSRRLHCQAAKRGVEFHNRKLGAVQAIQKTQSHLVKLLITGGIVCFCCWLLLHSL